MISSLRQILADHPKGVVIPRLQRDYAQGRADVRDVRERFVDDLHAALTEADRLLDLDFVYGTADPADPKRCFSPLDGQQRLTTLFLLHWYLATRDGQLSHFRGFARDGEASRFSYDVRPSAKDFFNALVGQDVDLDVLLPATPGRSDTLSKTIEDQPWFLQSWRLDPTVVSCLVVLDTVHERFDGERGLYTRLVDGDPAPITFQLLDLKAFKLTDDLYIKMNARGQPLTAFETFKASFEAHVGTLLPSEHVVVEGMRIPLQRYVAQQFDTQWCDLFWSLRDDSYTPDILTMNMLRAVALVACERHGDIDDIDTINRTLDALRGARREGRPPVRTFFDYHELKLLSDRFVRILVALFDGWAQVGSTRITFLPDADYYDEAAMFRRVAKGETEGSEQVTMEGWVQFVGWCDYLLSKQPLQGLRAWMRVVANLARNTIYNRADELRSSLYALKALIEQAPGGLIEYLASEKAAVSGFNRQQVREERLKAQLMMRDARWRALIEGAETHPYFRGQIEFLLAFSGVLDRWSQAAEQCDWSDEDDEDFRDAFETMMARAAAVFPGNVTKAPDFLWERALLCEGDYLLPSGANRSFLEAGGRETSWKRLLRAELGSEGQGLRDRRDIVRRVLDVVDPSDVSGSLQARIDAGVNSSDEGDFPGWRQRLVAQPSLIDYCSKRQIRWEKGDAIYLLRKLRRSAEHKELFAAHLELELRSRIAMGGFAPFDRISCDQHGGATDHWLRLTSTSGIGEIRIACRGASFQIGCPAGWAPGRFDSDKDGLISVAPEQVHAVLAEIAVKAGG